MRNWTGIQSAKFIIGMDSLPPKIRYPWAVSNQLTIVCCTLILTMFYKKKGSDCHLTKKYKKKGGIVILQ